MTSSFQSLAELRDLLDALCEETITATQMQRLEELVLTHPEAEAYYVQYMGLYADLARHVAAVPVTTVESLRGRIAGISTVPGREVSAATSPVSPRIRYSLWGALGLTGVAAGLLIALALPWQRARDDTTSTEPGPEPVDSSVAVLLHVSGAEWEEGDLPTRPGSALSPGRLRLKSGLAQIEFYSGATVILEGPADFQLISRAEAYCARGKLRATIPPQAHGFTIGTPKLDLVDRETEFGLQVGAGDKTEVHVFSGKLGLFDPGHDREATTRKELTTGRGICLDGPGIVRSIESNQTAFPTAQKLESRSEDIKRLRQQDWLAASEALRRDPSLVVYYPFQAGETWNRTLPDQARGRLPPHDGAIVGCSWVAGRWSRKQGLEFKRVSDRVRFHVPGEFDSLALTAWVRVDALPNRNNSLMMSDGWPAGAPHWQIGENGMLILGVQNRSKERAAHYHAPGVLTPERFGQWIHLAVVYDRDNHRVTHYVDGQPASQQPVLFDIPLRVGDAEIGNWNIATHRNPSPVRYFTGCMDEFMLFSRALSDQEVERLYSQGRPPL